MADQNFDLVVLGGGSGGYAAALRASELGMSVGLIEKNKVGGTCLHVGCIPTKALLHSAEIAEAAKDAAKFGIFAHYEGVDIPGVKAYKDEVISSKYKDFRGSSRRAASRRSRARASSPPPRRFQVGADTITGTLVVLATGSYSRVLPGIEVGGRIITSEQALELDWAPKNAIVLGGGVIGVEFSSVCARGARTSRSSRRCRTSSRTRTSRSRSSSSGRSASAGSSSSSASASSP